MWRAGLLIVMLTVYSTGCIAQQLQFYAAQGLIRDPQTGELTYDFIPIRDPQTSAPVGDVFVNLMFINRPGLLQQPVRSALFFFLPNPPVGNPPLLLAYADPSQASNNMAVLEISKRFEQVGLQAYEARILSVRVPARAIRLDQQGNPTEQQGTLEITVLDFHPFSFRRPKPDQPRDRIRILYYEGPPQDPTYRFPPNPLQPYAEYEINAPTQDANFFVHGRDVPR